MGCDCDFIDATIEVESSGGSCPLSYSAADSFNVRDIVPGRLCLHAFHAFYPYMLTLYRGGWVSWVPKGDGVIVQCPCPEGVVAKIFKEDSPDGQAVKVEVIDLKGPCSFGHKTGDKFVIREDGQPFCMKALYALCPQIASMEMARASCPKPGGVRFLVRRKEP